MLRNISLTFITSPVFVKSAFYAFINKRTSFKVTPKGDSSKIPFSGLKAQYTIMFISATGFAYAIYRYIISGNMEFIFNGGFMLYFLLLSMSIFYYNR
ncbi:hypothetical protein [Picrophilus oshimae]|uniref:Uncharacterized protein n=1 Tax=Picrophilus torridus (strain ATCC 700027 / DSM 9790 / JCM 10055 / NBRC 100828 / KAW 2/3) TaxID=1122961 RepID=Q6KZX8_PICTO|nr:hypothetical protein [Picrophilus oshimae]AAT43724.1 hypothetical protein PTO1139 [Picrophilus oshimae DSM 9789]